MRWSPVVNPPCLYILLRGAVICPSLSVGHRGVGPQRPVPTDRPALKTTSASPGPEAGTPTQRCGLARCASEFRSVRPFTHRPQVSGDMKQNGLLRVDIQSCTFPLAIWGPGCGLVTLRCSGAWGGIPGVLWRKDTSLIRQREEAASARNRGVGGGSQGFRRFSITPDPPLWFLAKAELTRAYSTVSPPQRRAGEAVASASEVTRHPTGWDLSFIVGLPILGAARMKRHF